MALLLGAAAQELSRFNSVHISISAYKPPLVPLALPLLPCSVAQGLPNEGVSAGLPRFFSLVQSYSL